MGMVAKKIAIARKAIEEIASIEFDLERKGTQNEKFYKQEMDWLAIMAKNAGHAASDSVVLLKGIKSTIEQYLREL
jgi:uncharacterized protein YigA (DUF484 family)